MKTKWLATTALIVVLGSGTAWTQAQMPQSPGRDDGAGASGPKLGVAQEPVTRRDRRAEAKEQPMARQEMPTGAKSKPAARDEPPRGAQQADPKGSDHNAPSRQAQDDQRSKRGNVATEKSTSQRRENARSDEKPGAAGTGPSDTPDKIRRSSESRVTPSQDKKQNHETRDQDRTGDRNAAQQKRNAETAKPDRKAGTEAAAGETKRGEAEASAEQDRRNTAQGSRNPSARDKGERDSTRISETERTRIFSTLDRRKGADQQNLNIEISVGQRLPPRARIRPLPSTIVQIVPQYRGYHYVMLREEIVIVRPGTREVVDVIRKPGSVHARTGTRSGTRVTLSAEQKQVLIRDARKFSTAQASGSGSTCLSYRSIPSSLVSESPELRPYRYIAIGEEVVLVDPDAQKIVEVIR